MGQQQRGRVLATVGVVAGMVAKVAGKHGRRVEKLDAHAPAFGVHVQKGVRRRAQGDGLVDGLLGWRQVNDDGVDVWRVVQDHVVPIFKKRHATPARDCIMRIRVASAHADPCPGSSSLLPSLPYRGRAHSRFFRGKKR